MIYVMMSKRVVAAVMVVLMFLAAGSVLAGVLL